MPDNVIVDDNAALDKLAAALSKAQAEIVPPKKSHTAKVPTKAGGNYSYTYSTLDELVDALRKPLAANQLSYIQRILQADHSIGVETQILHASGQWLSCGALLLPSGETPQAMGSALTYARRYSLSAAFGVASEDDDDGGTAERETKAKPSAPKPAPVAPPIVQPVALTPTREPGDEPDDIGYAFGPDDDVPADHLGGATNPREGRLRQPNVGDTISEARQKRLFAIAKSHGWSNEAIKTRLQRYGFEHTRDIPVAKYDDIVAMFEEV